MNRPLKIFIAAGEVSGDMHAAHLMGAMRRTFDRPLEFRGIGGDAMRAEGAELFYHTDQLAALGLWEVVRQLRFFKRVMNRLHAEIAAWQPDLVLTVDYPGFNIRLARWAHDQGCTTAHYISPKVWAWKKNRIHAIARAYDLLLCIFPFEPACYALTPLKALFVGNPLVAQTEQTAAEPPPTLPWAGEPRIGLLPGSRTAEIERILPVMLDAAVLLEKRRPGCSFVLPTPTRRMRELAERVIAAAPVRPSSLAVIDGQARHVMRQAQAAIIASGTATLESTLMDCPTVLVYRTSLATYWFAKTVLTGIRHLALTNIIAGREILPERLQDDCTPQNIADTLEPLLDDTPQRATMLKDFRTLRAQLGDSQAADRAAQALRELLENQSSVPLQPRN